MSSIPDGSRKVIAELAALVALILIVCLPFAPVFKQGKTLSKLSLIKEIDYLQRGDIDGHYNEISSDPSAAICHVPNEKFASEQDSAMPLWNQLSGCGRPVVGDFQTLLFSFFHRCFPVMKGQLFGLEILSKVIFGAIGAYCFARFLGVSRLASMAAGSAYALSPRCLLFSELCNNYCFYPWMLTCAYWASSRFSVSRAAVLALVLASLAYNMHPETFVIGTGSALVLFAFRLATVNELGSTSFKRLMKVAGWTAVVGLLSFLISAPLVLPFCEFLLNGESYKFNNIANVHIEFVTLFSYLSNLSIPMFDGSTCVGPILAILTLPGLVYSWRRLRPVVLIFLAALLFSTRPGPLEFFFALKPISYLLPEYTIYMVILLSCVFGALGLDGILRSEAEGAAVLSRKILVVCGISLTLWTIAMWITRTEFFCEFWSEETDWAFANQVMEPVFIIAGLVSIALVFALSLSKANAILRLRRLMGTSCVAANALPLMLFSSHVLPVVDNFWYKEPSAVIELKRLQQNNSYRSTATGAWIFQPSSNLIFSTDDFRCTAPLHPRRYAKFIDKAGIVSRNCNIYGSPISLNHLYDLASVRYILSNVPVHSTLQQQKQTEQGSAIEYKFNRSCKLMPGLRLEGAVTEYYPDSREILAKVSLTLHKSALKNYVYRLSLLDDHGNRLWISAFQLAPLEADARNIRDQLWELPISAPLPLKYKGQFSVVLQIGQFIAGKIEGPETVLSSIKSREPAANKLGRLERIVDFSDYLQIYENKMALPSTYLVHEVYPATNPEQSLDMLSDETRDWRRVAIIEGRNLPIPQRSETMQSETSRILNKDSDSVSIYVLNKSPSYLVLTDTFFPGWNVYVDGKRSEIHPANYAFRAVYLDKPGKHSVFFAYEPESFLWGLRLMEIGLGLSLALLLFDVSRVFPVLLGKIKNKNELETSDLSPLQLHV